MDTSCVSSFVCFDVNGEVNADCYRDNGVVVAGTCSSDARLKKNVREIAGALDKVVRLRPVSFEYKDGAPVRQAGLVAQEVERVMPSLVVSGAGGMKKVRYGLELQMHLLQALKELHVVVEAQGKEIVALRARARER